MIRVPKKPPPDAQILKNRAAEDKLRYMQQKCSEEVYHGVCVKWEANTAKKIEKNVLMLELSKLRSARASALHSRREQLAQKLHQEEEGLRDELVNSVESPFQLRAALMSRAKVLWEAREAERQALANSLLERHFRYLDALHERVFIISRSGFQLRSLFRPTNLLDITSPLYA